MKAILPVLDESRKRPYYLQLYDYIKRGIMKGEIGEDERLPSLRSLSSSTGLSITTIEQCYNQLLVEGYIYSKAQSGYYVGNVFSHSNKNMAEEGSSMTAAGRVESDSMGKQNAPLIYDPDCFDFNKWKKCMNKVITEFPETLFFESDPLGEPSLRNEIAKYLYMSRGVSCSPDQIMIAAGTQQITSHLSSLLRRLRIEHVALEEPGYMPVKNIFRDRGFAITPVDVADNGLVLEKLPTNIRTAVYVSPSNHSFTGSVMPVARRYELINWAVENDSYILEDDYDSELRYFGKPIPALKSLGNNDHVIYLGSFSSTLFAAVKISYMVLPEEMASLFRFMAKGYSQTCSKLEQLTLAMFMETGYYQTHIKKLRKLYSHKLDRVNEILRTRAGGFIDFKNTSSGVNILLRIDTDKTNDELKKDASDMGIPLISLHSRGMVSLYYNQIPLADMDDVLGELIERWQA